MLNSSYGALRQFQSKIHNIKTFEALRAVLKELDLKVYFSMRAVGLETITFDVSSGCLQNLEHMYADISITGPEGTIFSGSLEEVMYPKECSLDDLQFIWTSALRKELKL